MGELDVVRIQVTEAERVRGTLDSDRLELVRQALLDDGLTVLDDLVPVAVIDDLRTRMEADLPALVAAYEGRNTAFPGQLQQPPPIEPEHLHREILANPVVLDLCQSLLGPNLAATFYAANTNMPGSTRQEVHCDLPQLWPDLDPVHAAPYGLICNVPLVDTTVHTATELWPGTHLDGRTNTLERVHRDIPHAWLDERRAVQPPVQVPQTKGSAIIRDVRLWHTGVANSSDQVRMMVGVGYAPPWYGGFSIPIPDVVGDVLAELGVPPITRVNGSMAVAAQIVNGRRPSSTGLWNQG